MVGGRQRRGHHSQRQYRDAFGRFSRSPSSTGPRHLTSSSSPATHAAIDRRLPTPTDYPCAAMGASSTQGQIRDGTPDSPQRRRGSKGSATTQRYAKKKKSTIDTKMELEGCYGFNKIEVTFSYSEESDDEDYAVLKEDEIMGHVERIRRAVRRNVKNCLKACASSTKGQVRDERNAKKKSTMHSKKERDGCYVFSKIEFLFTYTEESDDEDEEVLEEDELVGLTQYVKCLTDP